MGTVVLLSFYNSSSSTFALQELSFGGMAHGCLLDISEKPRHSHPPQQFRSDHLLFLLRDCRAPTPLPSQRQLHAGGCVELHVLEMVDDDCVLLAEVQEDSRQGVHALLEEICSFSFRDACIYVYCDSITVLSTYSIVSLPTLSKKYWSNKYEWRYAPSCCILIFKLDVFYINLNINWFSHLFFHLFSIILFKSMIDVPVFTV